MAEASSDARSATPTPSSRPASQRSQKSSRSSRSQPSSRSTEQTPLLARNESDDEEDNPPNDHPTGATTALLRSLTGRSGSKSSAKGKRRWPSIVALFLLCLVVIIIMLVGFFGPAAVEEYATQAVDFKPTKLSLDSLTKTGVRVQVQGDFKLDASKVEKKSTRDIGKFGTWIAKEVESGPSNVEVYLPEYGNILVGTAKIPGIKVNIRNGHTTHVSFFANLEPGSFDGIRNIANDWMEGRLGQLRVKGKARVPLKSGIFHLGDQILEQSMLFEGNDVPSLPRYDINKLNLREANNGSQGMGADVSITVKNDYLVDFIVPPVSVDVMVDNCMPSDSYIKVGEAETTPLHVEPKTDLEVNVTGSVDSLPDALTSACPNSLKSPLDTFLGKYIHGEDATIYINCCKFPDPKTPQWTRDLLKDITVPLPFAGKSMGHLIKNFSLEDVKFSLPELFADPGTPESQPQISATINVLVGLPEEMNFPLNVSRVRAIADVFYKNKPLGILHLDKWQKASSSRIDAHDDEGASLLVKSAVKKAPLEITDDDLFSEVVSALIFGGKAIYLTVKADVDVGMDTPMGKFAVRQIPAEGTIPVKPIGKDGGSIGSLSPKIGNLKILDTGATSLTLQAEVNFTNPTNYSATVPYFNINILVNDTILGSATATNVFVVPGNNTNVTITAVYDPFGNSGEKGKAVGRELLSQYISGYNTTLTLKTHNGTIPSQPALGFALSAFGIDLPTPSLSSPKKPSDGDDPDGPEDDGPHFIKDATMHLISSTAIFTLASPLSTTTLYITHLNATSFYEGDPAGKILYELPFAVPPGLSESPRLPVDWSIGGVGYDAIRKALGGQLKLSAFAEVGVRVGLWNQRIWYQGKAIGANVRL
ncbi:hypothetical protein BU16DRAFT_530611 [Lophium mytilinum]|uniref:Pre-rRNA processing protein n=1 Tax=Lophium mytilinum TaxID=390894 RepID=A0A6A6QFZ6_9PEZI|nr:hypothetical protein BU16DRAFT_530611 [Lophium mytilinum]